MLKPSNIVKMPFSLNQ